MRIRQQFTHAFTSTITIIIALLFSVSASGAKFSVGPVRLSLPINSPSTTVELRSGEFKKPIILQATVYRWEQKDNQRVLTETDELTLSPSVVKLNPGDVQTLLVRAQEKSLSKPLYYRLRIEEVPSEVDNSGSSQVNFRKTFDLPVFIENAQAPEQFESKITGSNKSGEWQAEVLNTGERHIAISSVEMSIENKVVGSTDKFTYVLPGSSVQISIPVKEMESDLTITGDSSLRFYNMKSERITSTAN